MSLHEDARRLLDVALDAGAAMVTTLVNRTRTDLSPAVFAELPERDVADGLTAIADLGALGELPGPAGQAALGEWTAIARAVLGRRSERVEQRRGVDADELGHDPALAATVSRLEKTKVELLDDLVSVQWIAGGARAAPAVAYVAVPRFRNGVPYLHERPAGGTAFLVAPGLVMTAFHVVEARDRLAGDAPASDLDRDLQVGAMTLMFDYVRRDANDRPSGKPHKVTMVAFDVDLDVAVLRLTSPLPDVAPVVFRTSPLPKPKLGLGFVANIVQHPNHAPKKVGLRNNAVYDIDSKQLYYFTDTMGGSSGAPVFDDDWHVIAIHTGWDPIDGDEPVYLGRKMVVVNRGTLATRLIDYFGDPARAGQVPLVTG